MQIIPRNPVVKKELGNGTGNFQADVNSCNTAKEVYNNAINILNTAAQTYVAAQPNLIAIAESSRCVGSIPDNPSVGNTAMYSHSEGTNNYFSNYDGKFNAGEDEATYRTNNNNKANYEIDKAQLDSLSIANIEDTTNGSNYWLASRFVSVNPNITNFFVRAVDNSGSIDYSKGFVCSVSSSGGVTSQSFNLGLRPCITLKQNIKVTKIGDNKYLGI